MSDTKVIKLDRAYFPTTVPHPATGHMEQSFRADIDTTVLITLEGDYIVMRPSTQKPGESHQPTIVHASRAMYLRAAARPKIGG